MASLFEQFCKETGDINDNPPALATHYEKQLKQMDLPDTLADMVRRTVALIKHAADGERVRPSITKEHVRGLQDAFTRLDDSARGLVETYCSIDVDKIQEALKRAAEFNYSSPKSQAAVTLEIHVRHIDYVCRSAPGAASLTAITQLIIDAAGDALPDNISAKNTVTRVRKYPR